MKRGTAVLLTLMAFFIYACKKETKLEIPVIPVPVKPVVPVVDYEMLHITKPEWLIYKVDVSGTNVWLIPGLIATCTKDDTYRFYKDSVLTTYENADKCSGNPDSSRSNWRFIDGRKKIEATLLGNTDTADINELTDSTMRLYVNYNGTFATVFFKKK